MKTFDAIVVLTSHDDPTADAVISILDDRRARVVRVDTGDFPMELRLSATTAADGTWTGRLHGAHTSVELEQVRSVYYRRPTKFRMPAGMSPADEVFAAVEARHSIGGLLATLDVCWVNNPVRQAVAEYKPLQLTTAAQCGLRTPRTLLSNEAGSLAEFVTAVGGPVVCKPLSGLVFTNGAQMTKPFTTVIDPHTVDPAAFDITANLIQEWVPKAREVRVTAAGRTLISIAITAHSPAGHVDWRADYDALTYDIISTPPVVAAGIHRYLDTLGLTFGAFDFVITPDDQWVMLECNPAGQWLWLEHETGAPIAAAIADLLQKGQQP